MDTAAHVPIDETLRAQLRAGQGAVSLRGSRGAHLALTLARLSGAADGWPTIAVAVPDAEQARDLARDLAFFLGEEGADEQGRARVLHFAEVETSPYAEISPDRTAIQARMGVLHALRERGDRGVVLVGSASALRRRVLPPETFAACCFALRVGFEPGRDELAARLVAAGYARARVVEDPGTFAVRGGIVDVYPPAARYPYRVELYGDAIESLRIFDPETQRTLREVEELSVYPGAETVRSPGVDVRARILEAADAARFPSRQTKALLDELDSGREFFGIEALVPALHPQLVPLAEHLPQPALWALVDPDGLRAALEAEDERAVAAWEARVAEGRLTYPPQRFFSSSDELLAQWGEAPQLRVPLVDDEAVTAGSAVTVALKDNADLVAELRRARSERGEELLAAFVARQQAWREAGARVVIAAGSVAQLERLEALLAARDVPARVEREPGTPYLLDDRCALPAGALALQVGELGPGFRTTDGLVLVAAEEIYGPKPHRRRRGRGGLRGLADLREIAEGDYVVHELHGIGAYRGLVQLDVAGVPADFLRLEYAGNDRLYLPVYRMDQVQKYAAAPEGERGPQLDRLGGSTWKKKRARVSADVRRLGEELLQLYAQRAALTGHAFPEPDAVYREFEAGFPYDETADQQDAVDHALADLTAPRPMDRLVCGDVGFGKTEVALRAAFCAAMSGKQVAVLAPTTVLVEQHQRTFSERMAPYPLNVASLSRFRKPAEVQRVLAGLQSGVIDIVIGTHRLLSADVSFRDLGLLIIDEEQRFGVAHKERLKRLRAEVDVLTMTATPIPRTLQMSMVGLREISVITTPPPDRLAVRTFVTRFEERLVAEAIAKELARGGQVFFVHNAVEDIDHWAAKVSALAPRARIAVAHGQMDNRRLERVMLDFVVGRHDVLVCTTIIESGLDIPRANTMFVNRADRFGLAQLYQLRGRIGRSKQRAFCYLLVPGIEALSGEARQRLAALERFAQLGSGFSVAGCDLEIRGAGELLGGRQSGHIAALGFDAYARILEEAVAELKGEPIHRPSDPELNISVPAFIPDDYVEDTGQRLELYQRLSRAAADEEALAALLAELADRYGPRPREVEALGALMVVKGLAARLAARVVDLSRSRLVLTLDQATPLDPDAVKGLVADRRSGFRLTPPVAAGPGELRMKLIRALTEGEQDEPLEAAKKILRGLLGYVNQLH